MVLFGGSNSKKLVGKNTIGRLTRDALHGTSPVARGKAVEALGRNGGQDAVVTLVKVLGDKDEEVRESAAAALDALGWVPDAGESEVLYRIAKKDWDKCALIGEMAVAPLLEALTDRYWPVRRGAVTALGNIDDPRVPAPLLRIMIVDEEWPVRMSAAEALGRRSDPCVSPYLLKALGDRNAHVQQAAAEALVRVGGLGAAPALMDLLRSRNRSVRRLAATTLKGLGWAPEDAVTESFYRIAGEDWDGCLALGVAAVEALVPLLRDEDKEVRLNAAELLRKLEAPEAVAPLIAILNDASEEVRITAAEALTRIGSPSVEPLIGALRDRHRLTRKGAAALLGRMGDPRAVEPLVASLGNEEDLNVVESVAESLGKLGDPRSIPVLIKLIQDRDRSLRKTAADALAGIGSPAIEPLVAVLRSGEAAVRSTAATALEVLDWRPPAPELEALYRIARGEWKKCVTAGPAALEPLTAVLRDRDWSVRMHAAEALGEIGCSGAVGAANAVPPLIDALKDDYRQVRGCAAQALGRIGDRAALEPLRLCLGDRREEVRMSAAAAINQIEASAPSTSLRSPG